MPHHFQVELHLLVIGYNKVPAHSLRLKDEGQLLMKLVAKLRYSGWKTPKKMELNKS